MTKNTGDFWQTVDEFGILLAKTEPGAPIGFALERFGKDRVAPFIYGTRSFQEMDEYLGSLKTHFSHMTVSSNHHPRWAQEIYPQETIQYAEDVFLDNELLQKAFPNGNNSRIARKKSIRFKWLRLGLSDLAASLTLTHAQYQRIIHGCDEIFATSTALSEARAAPQEVVKTLEGIRRKYDVEKEDEPKTPWTETLIVRANLPFFVNVQSSSQYRTRQRMLEERTHHLAGSFDIRSDFATSFNNNLFSQIREAFFKDLFRRAYDGKQPD